MDTADREVMATAADWLQQGSVVYLVTVIRTWGSSPRPAGSLLVVRASDGVVAGSVSGGCVEDDLCARLASQGDRFRFPMLDSYGVTADQARHFGLPCGGRLDLVIERLESAAAVRPLVDAIDHRRTVTRRLCLDTGEASLHDGRDVQEFLFDGKTVSRQFGPRWRLLLIGAGQLSRFVAEIGQALDYEVVVCEPREDYAGQWSLAGAAVDPRMPDDVVRERVNDARTAVLALTHDPRIDDLALLEALKSPAFYVGALGSRTNSARRRARLARMDIGPAGLERLHAPIGLPIGSRTPAEIAVAILAGVTAVRRGADTASAVVGMADSFHVEADGCGKSSASC